MRSVAFVNRRGDEERSERAGEGELYDLDFDPHDPAIVKVHYDLAAWSIDQRAELSQGLAEAGLPHSWDGDELVVPELAEERVDALFERLEQELGPFPIVLDDDAPSTAFSLDEWSDGDRAMLTESLVDSEVPHRWEGTTVVVAEDAEDAVDDILDAIEAGELLAADDDRAHEPPDGVLGSIFLAADRLARDAYDARSRTVLIDLDDQIEAAHPPYAFAPRTWARAVHEVEGLVGSFRGDAAGDERPRPDDAGGDDDDSGEVVERARRLRDLLRPFV